jgi:hypothetical protein
MNRTILVTQENLLASWRTKKREQPGVISPTLRRCRNACDSRTVLSDRKQLILTSTQQCGLIGLNEELEGIAVMMKQARQLVRFIRAPRYILQLQRETDAMAKMDEHPFDRSAKRFQVDEQDGAEQQNQ